jgi:hypothetical protein
VAVNKTIQMVNVSEEPVRVELGSAPGDGTTEYVIEPGQSQAFHENLCKPVQGAGRNTIPSILERMSMRTYPDGIRRPTLIPAQDAKKVRAEYDKALAAWKKAGSPPPKPVSSEVQQGQPGR